MTRGRDPYVQGRRLCRELRRLRETSGQIQQDVADALEWSLSKVIRIETGHVKISLSDLRALLSHFGVTDEQRVEGLLELSRDSRRAPWSRDFKDVLNPEFQKLLGFESSASAIKDFQPWVVPGLFQTEPYARALAEIAALEAPAGDPERTERWVQARMIRQELLSLSEPPKVHLILGQAALEQIIGGPVITAQQLVHLRDLAERSYFTLQILAFDARPHNGLWGSFTIHELDDEGETEEIIFLESAGHDLLIRDDRDQGALFVRRFDRLAEVASQPEMAASQLDEAIRRLR